MNESALNEENFISSVKETFGQNTVFTHLTSRKHILTHQIIHLRFFVLKNYIFNFNKQKELNWVSLDKLDELPQPKVIHDFILEYL